jgi:hypothetical protein
MSRHVAVSNLDSFLRPLHAWSPASERAGTVARPYGLETTLNDVGYPITPQHYNPPATTLFRPALFAAYNARSAAENNSSRSRAPSGYVASPSDTVT